MPSCPNMPSCAAQSPLILSTCPSRSSPRFLCTAAQRQNGQGPEDEGDKPEQSATEKASAEEKSQLEGQLKEVTVSLHHQNGQTRIHIMSRSLDVKLYETIYLI